MRKKGPEKGSPLFQRVGRVNFVPEKTLGGAIYISIQPLLKTSLIKLAYLCILIKYFISLDSSLKDKKLIMPKSCITAVQLPPFLLSVPRPLDLWLSNITINFPGERLRDRLLERSKGALAND